MITWTTSEHAARQALEIYTAMLDGRGCACVQRGRATTSCRTSLMAARRDVTAIVHGHPELQAQLREAATRVLALPENRNRT